MAGSEAGRKIFSLLLTLCLLMSGCAAEDTAETAAPAQARAAAEPAPTEQPGPRLEAEAVSVLLDGEELYHAYNVAGRLFLPLHSLCERLNVRISWTENESGLKLSIGGTELLAEAELDYMTAGGRYLYAPAGWINEDGGLWLEQDASVHLLGLSAAVENECLCLSSQGFQVLRGGEDYYELNFGYDMLYWLCHIIYAEAGDQPLEGMIGVGNVVLNRMASDRFPDDITSVIYDREDAVQFEPVMNGHIAKEPSQLAIIAAYLCLEGYNTVDDSLFFMDPDCGVQWFDQSLQLVTVIEDHNFYKYPED